MVKPEQQSRDDDAPDPLPPIDSYPFDDDLINATTEDRSPRWRAYCPPEVMVVLGRGSKPGVEVDLAACEQDRVPIYRRRGGGCAVVLDPGNVVVSAVLPLGGLTNNRKHLDTLCSWLASGLSDLGFHEVRKAGISDLAVGERKVAGSCIYRNRDVLYFSISLLINPDLGRIGRYLKHPPREPDYRDGRDHLSFVDRLPHRDNLPATTVAEQLSNILMIPRVE